MCRFVAYIGKNPLKVEKLLISPENSLIRQSKCAREGITSVNGDGFGLGWYDFSVNKEPSVYKSIMPAWNDKNLLSISSKLSSPCFVGHVRASTIGDVSLANCHPFIIQNNLFIHNGTIMDFEKLKHDLIKMLSTPAFLSVKGQTDSEYFFALMNHYWKETENFQANCLYTVKKAIETILSLKRNLKLSDYIRLNCVLTNGRELMVIRYKSSDVTVGLPIYYSQPDPASLVVVSEPLDDLQQNWFILQENHILFFDLNFNVSLEKI